MARKSNIKLTTAKYNKLLVNITSTLQRARENAIKAINTELVSVNWLIGKYIVEYEQQGIERAEYGTELLVLLSKDLKTRFGKGFSRSSLQLMRLFYIKYPGFHAPRKGQIRQTVSGKSSKSQASPGILLSWSHYAELLTISDDLARSFYEKQAIKENWSFREMKRQINSALFQRLALSKDRKGVLAMAKKGNELTTAKDAIKDPYIFEFLELPKGSIIKETNLEKKLIDNL
jgi:hypothetical protein